MIKEKIKYTDIIYILLLKYNKIFDKIIEIIN